MRSMVEGAIPKRGGCVGLPPPPPSAVPLPRRCATEEEQYGARVINRDAGC
jgi:hypothetical protein